MNYLTLPQRIDALYEDVQELKRLLEVARVQLEQLQRTMPTPELIACYVEHHRWPDGPPMGGAA